MKKTYIGCLLGGFVCTAHAQSTITLYGIVDLGVTYVNNAKPCNGRRCVAKGTSVCSYGWNGDRSKPESLGPTRNGGSWRKHLKSLFVIENGFNANTGVLAQGGTELRPPGLRGYRWRTGNRDARQTI